MAIMQAKWLQAKQKEGGPKARSSHAVAVVGKKAYVFGGELEPRVPVDNAMYVFDTEDYSWSVAEARGPAPPPRIGITMVSVGPLVYVFGGRDKEHRELGEFYSFDTVSGEWRVLPSGPPERSYHAMAADDSRREVYVFGGCGINGRLNDLWAFNIEQGTWRQLPSPPEGSNLVPRGGPGLAVAGGKVWVLFGFGGKHELSDIHCFDHVTNLWQEVETSGKKPCPRSVFAASVQGKYIVVYGGEVDPSDKGHMGAGAFSSEVFALDTQSLEWSRVHDDVEGSAHPGPRGWSAFSPGFFCGCYGMLVYGGNSPSNERLDDIFFLQLQPPVST
uniref:Nitrile-specifier protein 5 n=1 Tax=Araucaria cunninghamii TaxID=56994 RepID=A0A0D6QZF2_ARACU